MDCNPPDSSVHGISQERILEWVAFTSPGDLLMHGLSSHLILWQTDSLMLSHQGSHMFLCTFLQFHSQVCSLNFAWAGGDVHTISTVQFSCLVSDSLQHHEPQHVRPPCPSPTPGVYPNSCPLSRWCHPAILSLSSPLLLPPIPPSIRVFSSESNLLMRWPKYWSFSFSISPSNEHRGLISSGWTG